MATAYWTIAGITLSIVVFTFLQDRTADKYEARALLFIVFATLLWPVTLPFIFRQKVRSLKRRSKRSDSIKRASNPLANGFSTAE